MEIYTATIPEVTPVCMITAKASYGVGFLTSIAGVFCSLLGICNDMYTKKMEAVEAEAMAKLSAKAIELKCDGVMDVRCQIDRLSFLVYGTAYKLNYAAPAKDSTGGNSKQCAPNPACISVPDGVWKCSCGRENPYYTSTCTCGKSKSAATTPAPDSKSEEETRIDVNYAPDGQIICPKCGTKQNGNRTRCFECGVYFAE